VKKKQSQTICGAETNDESEKFWLDPAYKLGRGETMKVESLPQQSESQKLKSSRQRCVHRR
jgi:hypothetical protein